MLLELAHVTPNDIIPVWRQRLAAEMPSAQRTRQLRAIGAELVDYAAEEQRNVPKETAILLKDLEEQRPLPPWITDQVPDTHLDQLRQFLAGTVARTHQDLRVPAADGADGMRRGMARAHATYTALRQAAMAAGTLPAVLGITDVHFRQIMADANDVTVLRAWSPSGAANTPVDDATARRLAEAFLVSKHAMTPSPTLAERLAARGVKRVGEWLGGSRTRLGQQLLAVSTAPSPAAQHIVNAATAIGGPRLPTLAPPAATTMTTAAREALQQEVDRRTMVRAALAQDSISPARSAEALTGALPSRDLSELEPVGQRLLREQTASAALTKQLGQLAEHQDPDSLTDALRILPASYRESIWIGTLLRAGEPPASVLRSIAANPHLSRADKASLSLAALGIARERTAQLYPHANPARVTELMPDRPMPLSLEADRFTHGVTQMVIEAHAAATPAAKKEAALAVQAYALELEIEQLDATLARVQPGDPLPAGGFAWTDAPVNLGSVTKDPALMRRKALGLPWSPEALWTCLKDAESPAPTAPAPTPSLPTPVPVPTPTPAAPAPTPGSPATPAAPAVPIATSPAPGTTAPAPTAPATPAAPAPPLAPIPTPTAPAPGRTRTV